jgi:hypothetical protein
MEMMIESCVAGRSAGGLHSVGDIGEENASWGFDLMHRRQKFA